MATVKPTMVHLRPELIALLDAQATREGVSRSALVRRAVEALLTDEQSDAVAHQYQEAYRIAPADIEDDWGDIEAWHQAVAEARVSDETPDSPWR